MSEPKVYELDDPEMYELLKTNPPCVDVLVLHDGTMVAVRIYQPRLILDGAWPTITGNVMVQPRYQAKLYAN